MSSAGADRGELALVLHSHMPYVEGFGTWPFGEEWLLEAIATSYLPLLRVLEQAAESGARGVATIGVTPVLADQLAVPELGERFLRFMRDVRRECHRQDAEGLDAAGHHADAESLRQSAADYEWAADDFERRGGDLLTPLRRLREAGAIELWASAASHAVLPMLATEPGLRLQVATGIDAHRASFGAWGGGFWLPECAYRPGIEEPLAAAGVRAFCVDQTGSGDSLDQLQPVATGTAVAIPIDWETISIVWDARGFPADPIYRDYHAHTVSGMRPWRNGGGPYDHDAGSARAREHAREFVGRVLERAEAYRAARGRPALVVCALDTELLGHWWYEGPKWLAEVIAESTAQGLRLTTLPGAAERHDPVARPLACSTWGTGKDLRTWDAPGVAHLLWTARQAEVDLVAAIERAGRDALPERAAAARRAARELLALQASDWSFMTTRCLAGDYPDERVRSHAAGFREAIAALTHGMADFRAMPSANGHSSGSPDERVRNLAPRLSLAPLLEPASNWER